jgi:hypothetical protein
MPPDASTARGSPSATPGPTRTTEKSVVPPPKSATTISSGAVSRAA